MGRRVSTTRSSAPRKAVASEYALKQAALAWLRKNGGYWQKNWGGVYTVSGRPDIEGCYRGWHVAIELKSPGQYVNLSTGVTPAQRAHLDAIALAGGKILVADALSAVQDFIRTIEVHP